jgi:hypothetical protein
MKLVNIKKAKQEAFRFIQLAERVEKIQSYRFLDDKSTTTTSKETGALRRASMDLTRSLSELRKSDYND